MTVFEVCNTIKDILWNGPLLLLLVGVAIYQTYRLKGLQFRVLLLALKILLKSQKSQVTKAKVKGDLPSFQALMTALAGSIGTGNITGIATAVMTGGFGALFWMWIMATLGMATAYSETVLGVRFRRKNQYGTMSGGPMYALRYGMHSKIGGFAYALLAGVATIGIGCLVQANSMVDAITAVYSVDRFLAGIMIAVLVGIVLIGGVKSLGSAAGYLVPFMAFTYISSALLVILSHLDQIPSAFKLIFQSAFTGQAATGGFLGSTIMLTMKTGIQYGIFANEAGLGSLAIAGSTAQVGRSSEQGIFSICGVFISTMLVCTLTGLVLAVTQLQGTSNEVGQVLVGSQLAVASFGSVYSSLRYIVLVTLNLFAFTTILAWGYYGEKCFEYLLGIKIIFLFRWTLLGVIVIGAIMDVAAVWAIANVATALMCIPNLISILGLSNVIKAESYEYMVKGKKKSKLHTIC